MLCSCQCCLLPSFLITPRTKCESWKVPPHSLPTSPLTLGNPFIYFLHLWVQFRSVQFSCSVVSNSLRRHEMQHIRPPCPSAAPGVYSNSHPLSQRCDPTISSSVIPFPSCLPSFPASGSFQMSQFFASGGQRIGVSASAEIFSNDIQDWFPLRSTGWIPLQPKGHSRVFPNTKVKKHQFFASQLSLSLTLTCIHDYWKNHSFD